jgi:hypothetical protein
MKARRRPKNDDRRLEGAIKEGGKTQRFFSWPNSHGRPAQVEKFSKMKNFQKQFQSLAISKLVFHLMDFVGIFCNEICKTHCSMSQR